MKRALVRNASLFSRNVLLSHPSYNGNPSVSIVPLAASNRPRLGLFSSESESDSSNESDLTLTRKNHSSIGVKPASEQELKRRLSIFEAILKRKMAGGHDEADNKLMEESCGKRQEPLYDMDDEEFDSDLDEQFDSDLDESSCETDEDFDAKEIDMKRRVRDE